MLYEITPSMSRKGDCWDNAVAESFVHTLKVEKINRFRFKTRDEAKNVAQSTERRNQMKRAFRMAGVVTGLIGMTVVYCLPATHAESPNESGGGKVMICHKPGTEDEKELLVPVIAVSGHLGHGDQLGACGSGDPGGR